MLSLFLEHGREPLQGFPIRRRSVLECWFSWPSPLTSRDVLAAGGVTLAHRSTRRATRLALGMGHGLRPCPGGKKSLLVRAKPHPPCLRRGGAGEGPRRHHLFSISGEGWSSSMGMPWEVCRGCGNVAAVRLG